MGVRKGGGLLLEESCSAVSGGKERRRTAVGRETPRITVDDVYPDNRGLCEQVRGNCAVSRDFSYRCLYCDCKSKIN